MTPDIVRSFAVTIIFSCKVTWGYRGYITRHLTGIGFADAVKDNNKELTG
jgi:hypothetical protein